MGAIRTEEDHCRYRLHILLNWEAGWFKSAILSFFRDLYGEGANNLTGSSPAALKGSFINGKFFPPELLISNIIVSSEFSSIIHSNDKEILSLLLIALEEGTVRNALVKGGNLNNGERQRIEEYEATFQDNRLCYQTHSTM